MSQQTDPPPERALSALLTLAEDLFGSDADAIVTKMTEQLNPILKSCGVEIVKDPPAASINPDGSVRSKARLQGSPALGSKARWPGDPAARWLDG